VFEIEQSGLRSSDYFGVRPVSALTGGPMDTDYDLFEVLFDRSVKWRSCVRDRQRALDMLKVVGSRTFNQCFAINLRTHEIIGRVNSGHIAAQPIVEDHRATAR
jgi:hypothetical protein